MPNLRLSKEDKNIIYKGICIALSEFEHSLNYETKIRLNVIKMKLEGKFCKKLVDRDKKSSR